MTNTGPNEVKKIFLGTESPRDILFEPELFHDMPLSIEKDLRNISNEAFNKDKEARRQFVTKILDDNTPMKPNTTKTLSAFIQAPHGKGRKSIKILIFFSVPQDYPKIKYRLVRHEITMNVNDSLRVDAKCNIANEQTGEVGLDIVMKNMNQTHHLFSIDVSVGDLYLFCQKFSLNQDKIYFINNLQNTSIKKIQSSFIICPQMNHSKFVVY